MIERGWTYPDCLDADTCHGEHTMFVTSEKRTHFKDGKKITMLSDADYADLCARAFPDGKGGIDRQAQEEWEKGRGSDER